MSQDSKKIRYCVVPKIPEREFERDVSSKRARLIRNIEFKWVNGTPLHYYFFDEPPLAPANDVQKEAVRKAFDKWMDVGIGIKFKEVASPEDAEIKIGFDQSDGSWSYIGKVILKFEHTMNFGWDLTTPHGADTAIHEIGHTLGFQHEHQNPYAGLVWDEDAVYDYFSASPNNWDRDTIERNILNKIHPDSVAGSKWDPNSIMHYQFDKGLIREPEQYQNGIKPEPGLSAKDIAQVTFFYPKLESKNPELKLYESQILSLKPGEQKNFSINIDSSRDYTFNTFGKSDTVMVLFEEDGDEMHYVIGDDDSGTSRNAKFTVRLIKGRKYVLRIRLYYKFSSGNTAVMTW